LHALLGGWPAAAAAGAELLDAGQLGGMCVERLRLRSTRPTAAIEDRMIPAILTKPAGRQRWPVVLYCHAHGNDYAIGKDELLNGRPGLPQGPYAPQLAEAGIAALAIDLPCFGERALRSESALAKQLLWQGDTLFGVMLRELAGALDYLASRSDIDGSRIATLGLSMGCTTGWWLAALDDRVAAVAGLCCLADLAGLIETGGHDLHGLYMTVPGLVDRLSTAEIARLIVPRPHLSCIGARDPLTPPTAVAVVGDALARAYAEAGHADRWSLLTEPTSGHVETPRMRAAVLAFLRRYLVAGSQPS